MGNPAILVMEHEREDVLKRIREIRGALDELEHAFDKEETLLSEAIVGAITYTLIGPGLAKLIGGIMEREVKIHDEAQNISPDKFYRD